MKNLFLLITMFTSTVAYKLQAQHTHTSFKPGADVWADTDGKHINAHGGGLLLHDGKYYWFGEHKIAGKLGNRAMVGVSVYSSNDLYNWINEGVALEVSDDTTRKLQRGCTIERPKVLFNEKTNKFVMWFHHELKDQGYNAALTGLAVADKPTGPYVYIDSYRLHANKWPLNFTDDELATAKKALSDSTISHQVVGAEGGFVVRDYHDGQMSRDMTLFKDDDGTAYHVTASENNQTLHISKLSDDYLSITDEYVRAFPGGRNEAPTIFKKDGVYYMISSGLTGWKPNPARSAKATSMLGPWTELGNPVRGTEKEQKTTFGGQSTYVLSVPGKKDAFIFMADIWTPDNPIDGKYVWLPIQFEDSKPIVKWMDNWQLNFFK